jgi:hypothetical protein
VLSLDYKIIEEKEDNLKGLAVILKNGVFVVLSEGDLKFGTTAIALPIKSDEGFEISSIIPSFGSRNELLAKSISERIAQKLTKTVITTILIKEEDSEIINKALNLIKKMMEKL